MNCCSPHGISTLSITLSLVVPLYCPTAFSDDGVAADRCRELCETSVVDFYLPHCIDKQSGGYLEVLDETGQFTASDKFLTLQARQMWFFSTLAVADIRRTEALAAARTGYEFLIQHFRDPEHGGYFAKTSREGSPTDRRKHVYPNAFVIYGLVEYHRATGEQTPLEQALELFRILERHCYDQEHGGYNEFFDADWQLITDPSQNSYVGTVGTKTYNSHLHLLEAFAQLYRVAPDPLVRRRLSELVQINVSTFRQPTIPCNVDAWHPDWRVVDTPANLRASYGHDVECAWLVLDAAEALGLKSATLRSWARALCDHAIQRGRDPEHGGFFYTGPLGKPSDDRKKVWWTQAEALVAMLTMHQQTGDPQYREIFDETLSFIEKHQVAHEGGWWNTVQQDGSLQEPGSRTSTWQAGYHNGRALLLCEQLLRRQ